MADLPSIAVIADAHFHDPDSNYDGASTMLGDRQVTLRSWKDTRRSSRVFNESAQALRTALNNIRQRGIRHVVLLGDYTDDGQIEATRRLAELLKQYRQEYAMAFYAIPGNHDFYGPAGKHQSTRFVTAPDSTVLVTSDPEIAATEPDTSVLTRKIYCEGTPASLMPMAEYGLFRQTEYRYWETPFGQCDTPASRMFDARSADGKTVHRLMDASYLVEVSSGLWLLMIDANVFEPRNGRTDPNRKSTFLNSSDAGWNAVLHVKPFLIDWIKDVYARASHSGKTVYAFSHYPIMDPFDDPAGQEAQLFGDNENIRRSPKQKVASTLAKAGLKLHFSGHMHVNATTQRQYEQSQITDIAVPSIAAFPAAYKLIHPGAQSCLIDTASLNDMPLDSSLISAYRAESDASNEAHCHALKATRFGEFLYLRMRSRAIHHFLAKEWPQDLAVEIERTNAADLIVLLLMQRKTSDALSFGSLHDKVSPDLQSEFDLLIERSGLQQDDITACTMTTLVSDWYCLRHAGPMARPFVNSTNLRIYQMLTDTLANPSTNSSNSHAEFFGVFLSMFNQALQRLEQDSTVVITDLSV